MIEDVQLQKLVMMGMEACVIPSPHMFLGSHDADAVLLLPRAVYAPVWMAMAVGLALAAIGVALIRAGALALRRERR